MFNARSANLKSCFEIFSNESWSHYDTNLGKKNTIYTYMFLVRSKYHKKFGYSKLLKMIYINWCKKKNFKFVTGHVKSGISKKHTKSCPQNKNPSRPKC